MSGSFSRAGAETVSEPSSPRTDTAPVDSPDSYSVMGRMRTRRTRPAPVWRVWLSGGAAEPVRMNWPGSPTSSQTRRIGFQIPGDR